jgi:hypothetical protein
MQWKYRPDFQILPGVHLTYGKQGIKTTIESNVNEETIHLDKQKLKFQLYKPFETHHEIKSAHINILTSNSLTEFKNLLFTSNTIYDETNQLLQKEIKEKRELESRLNKLQKSLFKFLYKKRIERWISELYILNEKVNELEEQLEYSKISLEIDSDESFSELFQLARKSFSFLIQSEKKWDFTSSRFTNKIAERTSASNIITRSEIQLTLKNLTILHSDEQAMCFHNMNGGDLYFYPGFMIVYDSKQEFAVIDYNEISIELNQTRFIESDIVPKDSNIIDHTWYKVNKDGSPDRRFSNNYKIPIALYGELHFKSKTGLNEIYCFSNLESAQLFYKAFFDYIDSIKKANALFKEFN